jgi:hypothetical protein
MSPKPETYTLTHLNAVYANRALSHAYRALGVVAVSALLHLLDLDPADRFLDITLGAWIVFEFSQIIRYGAKSIKAGRRDGRTLTISIHEGAPVSISEEDAL